MNTGSNRTVKVLRFLSILTATLMALSIGGCGPSEKQLKEAENTKIEMLQSKVRNSYSDPAATQFRNVKLLSGDKVLCGEVNSKNEYGGYIGFKGFAVNSVGKIVILDIIPVVDVIALSKKTKEDRKEYINKVVVSFASVGATVRAAKLLLDLDHMEEFFIDNFSLWGDCFAEK